MYLFGSVAKGKHTVASDIDVLIVIDNPKEVDIYELKALVKKKYPSYPIELHIIDTVMLEKWYMKFVEKGKSIEI